MLFGRKHWLENLSRSPFRWFCMDEHLVSPEPGEVAWRGKAAASEGLLPLSRLSFLVAFNPSVILALLG